MVDEFPLEEYTAKLKKLIAALGRYKRDKFPGRSQIEFLILFATHERLSTYDISKIVRKKMAYKNVHKVIQRLRKDGFLEVVKVEENPSAAIYYRLSDVGLVKMVSFFLMPPDKLFRYYMQSDFLQLTVFAFFDKSTFTEKLPEFLNNFMINMLVIMNSHILRVAYSPYIDESEKSDMLATTLINQASKELLFLFSESVDMPETFAFLSKDKEFLSNINAWSNTVIKARQKYGLG